MQRLVALMGGVAMAFVTACDDGSGGTAGSAIGPEPMHTTTPGGGGPAAGPGGSTATPGSPAGACNSLDLGPAAYIKDLRGQGAPAMTGGPIADGTYHVTRYEWHNPINALHTRKTVMVIAGGRVQWASHRDAEKEDRMTATMTASGTGITFQLTCGDEPLPWDSYSASGNTLILHDDADVKTATFTRQ